MFISSGISFFLSVCLILSLSSSLLPYKLTSWLDGSQGLENEHIVICEEFGYVEF